MSRFGAPEAVSWQVVEARHAPVFLVFLVALAASALGAPGLIVEALFGGVLGYAVAAGLVRLWGERTRPKNSGGWALLVLLWLAAVGVTAVFQDIGFRTVFVAFLLMLPAALLARHDSGMAPTLLLAASVWAGLVVGGRLLDPSGERFQGGDAFWIGSTVVLGIAAATLEHERLARRDGAGTPVPWTVFRLAFVAVWTIVILSLREQVQWGRLFVLLGADLRGQAGQVLLIGILAAAIAVAAFAFRPAKRRPERPERRA